MHPAEGDPEHTDYALSLKYNSAACTGLTPVRCHSWTNYFLISYYINLSEEYLVRLQ